MEQIYTVYLGFGIALIAVLSGVIFPEYSELSWEIAGLLGFGSLAALRSFINSTGYKTYILAAIVVLAVIFSIFDVVSREVFDSLIMVALSLSGVTLQQALRKAESTVGVQPAA